MILQEGGRVRLTPHELNLLRQCAAVNGKAINSISTLDELLSAVVDGLHPSMAADLLDFLEQRHAKPEDSPDASTTPDQTEAGRKTATPDAEREEAAARWLIEQDDPDFSPEQRSRFESWLRASDENRKAYSAMERAWRWTLILRKPE